MVAVTVLYDDELPVRYGFFYLCAGSEPEEDLLRAREGQRNGLCGAQNPHQLALTTGLHTGEVPLRIEWYPTSPPIDAFWADVVEVSVEFTTASAILSSFQDSFDIELPRTGWHRARFCASGMDEGNQLDTPDEGESPPDRYLLQLWPAPQTPDEVIAEGSSIAAYWHGLAREPNS
jgi:hypothetical protein